MTRADLERWVAAYERAWRSPGTEQLAELFALEAVYLTGPYKEPDRGLEAIERVWERERDGPDEPFDMTSEVVAVDGSVGVVRVEVHYHDPPREWRDLWIVRLGDDGRCIAFEEWPIGPPERSA